MFLDRCCMTIQDFSFLKRHGWYWPLRGKAALLSNWMPKGRRPSWETELCSTSVSQGGCRFPVHCCRLSFGTSVPNLNSSVISVRCGVIASVCWWVAWSNNCLHSPSGLSTRGELWQERWKHWPSISRPFMMALMLPCTTAYVFYLWGGGILCLYYPFTSISSS